MTTHYKNIEQALKAERPMDKVVKILNNKFAIVQSVFTNGTFDIESLCGLDGKTIYFYGHKDKGGFNRAQHYSNVYTDLKAGFHSLKKYAEKVMQMPNAEKKLVGYNHIRHMVLKTQNNKHYKKAFRKILKLNIF